MELQVSPLRQTIKPFGSGRDDSGIHVEAQIFGREDSGMHTEAQISDREDSGIPNANGCVGPGRTIQKQCR